MGDGPAGPSGTKAAKGLGWKMKEVPVILIFVAPRTHWVYCVSSRGVLRILCTAYAFSMGVEP